MCYAISLCIPDTNYGSYHMYKIGVVGVPGAWSSERLADAVEAKTDFRLLVDLAQVVYHSNTDAVSYNNHSLYDLDALVIKKIGSQYSPDRLDRLEILKHMAKTGLRVFSNPNSISDSYSRISCTLKLLNGKIAMPETVITESVHQAYQEVLRFGEAVLKPLYSTKAKGMVLLSAEDPDLMERIFDYKEVGNKILYVQKKVNIPGKDLGVVFLGGKYIATYARVCDGKSWNTTTRNGGKYQAYEPDISVIQLADKAQKLFNLDFTSVDIVETEEGPKVFEVSAFGGFRGLFETTDMDPAELYIDYVIDRLKNG
jgi:tetrahydromethanopterin:alpha-L-glutamate ligase